MPRDDFRALGGADVEGLRELLWGSIREIREGQVKQHQLQRKTKNRDKV